LGAVALLAVFGLLMVYDSSVAIAIRDFNNPYYYVLEQAKWLLVGLGIFLVMSRISYKRWQTLALPILIATLILLLCVFIPGIGVKVMGARRWLNFGFFIVQPSEIAKLSLIIYLSAWLSSPEKERFGAFVMLLGMVVGLIVLQPDLGTGMIIISIAVVMYFISGAPIKHFMVIIPSLIAGVLLLAVISPYRFERLMTFVDPERDPQGSSYHIRQAVLAIGSGGWSGMGVGKSRQKYEYLPEANTDSIFAIVGEETGFIGSVSILLLYLFIVWRGFRISKHAPDMFGKLLAFGVSAWIGIQAGLNIGAITALLPLTGVPLPLVSNGGSSLVILLAALAIVTNISKSK
jgi:cell division protein FtsW